MDPHITIRKADKTWVVRTGDAVIAESAEALELTEGGMAPVIYFPRGDVAMPFLDRSERTSHCPHKGEASYFSLVTSTETVADVAWSYETPKEDVAQIKDYLAFYDGKVTVERL